MIAGGDPWASIKASWGEPDRPRDRWERLWIMVVVVITITSAIVMVAK